VSVVRLELTVPDDAAQAVANELAARYLKPGEATAAAVDIRSDADAQRDRVILRAAAYFLAGR
jgi:hypothetical protein